MADNSIRSASPIALEDANLVRQVQEGDTGAFGRLVTRYQDRVVNLCWRMCGNLDEAQDLAQESFLRAFEKLHLYRFEASFYTWLFRVAVNECLSHRRKSKRIVLSLHDGDGKYMVDERDMRMAGRQSADTAEPIDRLTARELHDELVAGLDRLEDDYRAIIILRDIEALDYHEIGQVLELSIGTVKSRLHRARLALREQILKGERKALRAAGAAHRVLRPDAGTV